MKLKFSQLDKTKKQLEFIEGVYPIEQYKFSKWMWTSQEFSIYVANIDYVTLTVTSDINNVLRVDESIIDLNPNYYNVLTLNTSGKTKIELKLENPHIAAEDDRLLGVKIINVSVDNNIIF